MKLILLNCLIACLIFSCKARLRTKIVCQNIQEITVHNKNADKNAPEFIIVNNPSTINDFCQIVEHSSEIIGPNLKDHSGYYEFAVKLKNGKIIKIDIILTYYNGIVISYGMRYYKSNKIEVFIKNYLTTKIQ
jgi:hypothetical protein